MALFSSSPLLLLPLQHIIKKKVKVTFFFFSFPSSFRIFSKLNFQSRTIDGWPLRKREKGKSKVKKKKSVPIYVVVWTTDERVCVYILVCMHV